MDMKRKEKKRYHMKGIIYYDAFIIYETVQFNQCPIEIVFVSGDIKDVSAVFYSLENIRESKTCSFDCKHMPFTLKHIIT